MTITKLKSVLQIFVIIKIIQNLIIKFLFVKNTY